MRRAGASAEKVEPSGSDLHTTAKRHGFQVRVFPHALCISLLAATASTTAWALPAIEGRVVGGGGLAVEHARVVAAEAGSEVFTDSRGHFAVRDCGLPCTLVISHPRFHDLEVGVGVDGARGELEITLAAKQEVYEHVDVTASRGGEAFAPESVASTVIKTEDKAAAPATLAELVEGVAGVAENGQGGIFQVFSIRGVSRHRVLTLVSGVPIIGERRAGVSTSFIDPTLMGSVDVLRGPASTYYGSGALGGVVQVFPKIFDGLHLDAGYDSFGDGSYGRIGWGTAGNRGDTWSLGLAYRTAEDGEAADGTELNSHFTQLSGSLTRAWSAGGHDYELQAIPSYGRDIGKSNNQFPERVTNYPRETHLLLRFGVAGDGKDGGSPWRASAFVHPNDLITADLRTGDRFTEVENEAFDFGTGWQREWSRRGGDGRLSSLAGRYGVDYVGRRDVNADERREDLNDGSITELNTLDGASQDEAAIFGSVRWSLGPATFQAGGRFTWQQQQNGEDSSPQRGANVTRRDDSAATAFLGYVRPLGKGFEITANAGTGLRFPNLSERFFTGTTGRGGVIGNPDLESESSLTVDLGLRWYGEKTFLSTQVFHQTIDDYVERVEITEDLLTFVNLTSGTIVGFEVEGFHQLSDSWLLTWSGHLLDGEDDAGSPLADVPANRLQLGLKYEQDRWQGRLQVQHRASRNDPGGGEKAIPEAQLVSASLSYRLDSGLALNLSGRNLLDEEYFNSADRRSPIAPGRTIGFSLLWSGS